MSSIRARQESPGLLPAGDDGFTLIELLIVILIVPMIIFGISAAIIASLQNQNTEFSRLSDTVDAQIASATFARDVQSASQISTGGSPVCPVGGISGGKPLLGLQWNEPLSSRTFNVAVSTSSPIPGEGTLTASTAQFQPTDAGSAVSDLPTFGGDGYVPPNATISSVASGTVAYFASDSTLSATTDRIVISSSVSWVATYWDVAVGPGQTAPYELIRKLCKQGGGGLLKSTTVLSHDMPPPANQSVATITCGPSVPAATCTPGYLANCWVGLTACSAPLPTSPSSTDGVTGVTISASEPASSYTFTLSSTPRYSSPASQAVQAGGMPSPSLLLLGGGPGILNLNSTGESLSVTGEMAFDCLDDVPCSNSLVEFDAPNTTLIDQSTNPGEDFQISNCAATCSVLNTNNMSGARYVAGGDPPIATSPAGSITPTPWTPAPPGGLGTQSTCPLSSGAHQCSAGVYDGLTISANNRKYQFGSSSGSNNFTFNGSGLTISGNNNTITFEPGNYTFNATGAGNGLTITGANDTIVGNGVFFYVNAGEVTINATNSIPTTTIQLSPMTTGASAGIVLYQVPTDMNTVSLSGSNDNEDSYSGAIQAPGAPIIVSAYDDSANHSNSDALTVQNLVAQSLSLTSPPFTTGANVSISGS